MPRLKILTLWTTIPFILLLLHEVSFGKPFSFKFGTGYETISQEYYQDSIIAGDSLAVLGQFQTTYLSQLRAIASIRYLPRPDNRVDLETTAEQSKDVSRFRFRADFSPKLGSIRSQVGAELDRRAKHTSNDDTLNDSYILGSFHASAGIPLGESVQLSTRLTGDFITFDSLISGTYDYRRFGAKGGTEIRLAELSSLTFMGFLQNRQVADSQFLNYLSAGIETFYFGLFEKGDIDLSGRWERRQYNRPDRGGDYHQIELEAEHNWQAGSMLLREHGLAEMLLFAQEDSLNPSRLKGRVVPQIGREFGAWRAYLGPAIEVVSEKNGGIVEPEDFLESGGEGDLELLTGSGLLASLNCSGGRRNLGKESADISDFWFGRLNLIVEGRILGEIRLSSLISADWEWHEVSSHDNSIYLVSIGLSYTL